MTPRELMAYYILTGKKTKVGVLNTPEIQPYYPNLTESDYNRGYFVRYLVRRYDGPTIEVSKDFYDNRFSKLPTGLYKRGALVWSLSDSVEFRQSYIRLETKSEDRNRSEIKELLPQFPDLDQLFNNLSEFKQLTSSETPTSREEIRGSDVIRDTTPPTSTYGGIMMG